MRVKLKQEELIGMARSVLRNKIATLPPADVPDFEVVSSEGDEETLVLLLSDIHFGHRTPTTTCRIISNRLERLGERIVKIANIHRKAYPIRRLVVFMQGDFCQGDQIGRFVSLDELENTVMVQVFEWAIPKISDFLLGLQEHFEQIDCYCVRGNHGSVSREAGEKTSWDTVIYEAVEMRLSDQPRISFHIEKDRFYMTPKIYKYTFLIQHGDNIRSYLNIPFSL